MITRSLFSLSLTLSMLLTAAHAEPSGNVAASDQPPAVITKSENQAKPANPGPSGFLVKLLAMFPV